jgi:hypothetical protein
MVELSPTEGKGRGRTPQDPPGDETRLRARSY